MSVTTTSVVFLPGPLTAFNPPSTCFSETWGTLLPSETAPAIRIGNPYDPACRPDRFETNVIYSPALCPTSYYEASKRVITSETRTETVLVCCPNNFSQDGGTWSCVSTFPSSLASVTYTYSTGGTTIITSRRNEAGQGLNAHSIQVRYQSSDSSVLYPTTSQNSSTSSTISSTSLSTSTTSPSATTAPSPSGTGVSTGAKAGIGIGTAIAVIAIVGLIFWFMRRKRRTRGVETLQSSTGTSSTVPAQQLASTPRYEMDTPTKHGQEQEGGTYGLPVELETPDTRFR